MNLFPHAAYAEAVHVALAEAGLGPTSTTVHISTPDRRIRNLLITIDWADDHPLLSWRAWPHGMRLVWRHADGWYADDPPTLLSRSLPIPLMSDPATLVATVEEIRSTGLYQDDEPVDFPGGNDRWEGAPGLDLALSDWEGQA